MEKPVYKQASFYLTAVPCVLALVSLIMYITNGATQYNKVTLAVSIIALDIAALAVCACSIVVDLLAPKFPVLQKAAPYTRFLKYLAFLLFFMSFLECIVTETNFLGNWFVGTDPMELSFKLNYIVILIPLLACFICTLVAGVIQSRAVYRAEKEEKEEEA